MACVYIYILYLFTLHRGYQATNIPGGFPRRLRLPRRLGDGPPEGQHGQAAVLQLLEFHLLSAGAQWQETMDG